MALDNVQKLLLRRIVHDLPNDSRIALCCAGKYLAKNRRAIRDALAGHSVSAVLDDAPDKLEAGRIMDLPVRPIAFATPQTIDAIIITSDLVENRMVRRFRSLADEGVRIIRTARIEQNESVTPAMIESLLDDPELDLVSRPRPWSRPLPEVPPGGGLEITSGCNLNCLMCDTHSATRPAGQMSLDMFARGLDELDAIGCKHLSYHTIGEPTIHKQFDTILQLSHERGFQVFLSTNGMLLDRYVDALTRWPVATLRFSIDGATKETYERIRVGGDFDRLLANLRLMHDAVVAGDLPTTMQIDVTMSQDNLHEVPLFFEVFGPYVDDDQISLRPINSLAAGARDYYQDVKLIDDHERMIPCPQLWEVLYVGHDGRVSACCRDYHGQLVVGDVTKQSLRQIWLGEAISKLRAGHLAGDPKSLPEACRQCYYTGSGRADLLTYMIAAIRHATPRISAEEFIARISAFTDRLSQAF